MGLWDEVVVEEEEAFFRWRSTKGEGEVVVRLSIDGTLAWIDLYRYWTYRWNAACRSVGQ